MATIAIPNFNTQKTMVGLNTYTYTIVDTMLHTCRLEVGHLSTSALTATISQSGSVTATLATVTLVAATDGPQSKAVLIAVANCTAADVITFTLSSSAVDDKQLNTVKANMIVTKGLTT